MKKELAYTIIKETDKYYYFFDKSGFYRRVDKDSERANLLVRCNINTLIENLFNKKIDDNRLSNVLSRLKPGDQIETLDHYINPEKRLAYRVLNEAEDDGNEHLYYYFDNNGIYTVTPYLPPLMFPINTNSFVGYILGLHVEQDIFNKAIRRLHPGDTIEDLESGIFSAKSEKISLPRNKKSWHKSPKNNIFKKVFQSRKFPFNKET